jgi:hypothetical protein
MSQDHPPQFENVDLALLLVERLAGLGASRLLIDLKKSAPASHRCGEVCWGTVRHTTVVAHGEGGVWSQNRIRGTVRAQQNSERLP